MGRSRDDIRKLHANVSAKLAKDLGKSPDLYSYVHRIHEEAIEREMRSRFGDWSIADLSLYMSVLAEGPLAIIEQHTPEEQPASVSKKTKRKN